MVTASYTTAWASVASIADGVAGSIMQSTNIATEEAKQAMHAIIVTRSHLLVGDHMPSALANLYTHLACYEIIIQQREDGDDS